MKTRSKAALFFILAWLISPSAGAETKLRSVLVLFNSADGAEINSANNVVTANLEQFLNHLGLIVDYRDINDSLPDFGSMDKYLGVISCFYGSSMKNPLLYLAWAERQLDEGRRFVILGNLGAFSDSRTRQETPIAQINHFMNKLGVNFSAGYNKNPQEIELVFKDPDMVEFERSLENEYTEYELLQPIDSSLHSYLTLRLKSKPESDSCLVAVGSWGGYVWGMEYLIHANDFRELRQLRINPYLFFVKALGLTGTPFLDVTTLCGRRVYYSHIDGDGLSSPAFFDSSKNSAEIIRDRVIKKYPALPVGVSFIAGEIEYNKDKKRIKETVRSIWSLPNVEPASHTYSHPMDWKKKDTGALHTPLFF
ncbi:MAG: hypothetical protein ACE5GM_09965 [bacterium]